MFSNLFDELGVFAWGALAGAVLVFCGLAIWKRRYSGKPSIGDILRQHFGGASDEEIEVHSREFLYRVCVDAYPAALE